VYAKQATRDKGGTCRREVPRGPCRGAGPGPRRGRGLARPEPGTGEELLAAISHQFQHDYGVVLRAVLLAVDRHRARQVTGISAEERRP
jgi:hypothetical protein